MRRRLWLGLFAAVVVLALASAAGRDGAPWPVRLQSAVAEESRAFEGEIAMVVEELNTGLRYTHNAATPTYLASVVKLPVMIAVFEALRAGRLRWEEELVFGAEDVRDGASVLKAAKPGSRYSVAQLTEMMMQRSDNAATDMLSKRVGLEAVNDAARRYGGEHFGEITNMLEVRRAIYRRLDPRADGLSALQIASLRKSKALAGRVRLFAKAMGKRDDRYSLRALLEAYEAYYDSGLNSAPLEAVARILAALERRAVVDPTASQQMLEIMLGCRTGSHRLRAGLPAEILLAHKTGTQNRRLCDVGIIYPQSSGPVLIAVCLKSFAKQRKAEDLVARLARRTYSIVVEGEPWPPLPIQ